MKPTAYGRNFTTDGPGQPGERLFPRSPFRPAMPRPTNQPENKSPYPGIHIGSASELLDFRFEDTELLQEREE